MQKVHDFGDDQVKRFNKTAIVIVRNPYRAVLSFHNYLFGGHKGMAPSANYLRKGETGSGEGNASFVETCVEFAGYGEKDQSATRRNGEYLPET